MWVDGIKRVTGAVFNNPQTYLSYLELYTGSASTGGFYAYLDAFDFSWAPGYYPNRNMKSFSAIYEDGIQKTPWTPWVYQHLVNYNVNTTKLGLGFHNISFFFNDGYGKWSHDDVIVSVHAIPNILKVVQNPIVPVFPKSVNITAHITDDLQVQTVSIESNHTGVLTNYSMTLLSGSGQDGIWNFTMKNYLANEITTYKIYAIDYYNYVNSTPSFNFTVSTIPNIMQITRTPITSYQQPVAISVHIKDSVQVQNVSLEADYLQPGELHNYSMTLLSGSLQDGIWNYTIPSYPANTTIYYRILVQNLWNNWNNTNFFNFSYFDIDGPNIVAIDQDSTTGNLTYGVPVNITVWATDNSQIQMLYIETDFSGALLNYSMTYSSGSPQSQVWLFTFDNYPGNTTIGYRIYAYDVLGNINSTIQYSFGYYDVLDPNILSVTQTNTTVNYPIIVNVTVQITDKTPIRWVLIEANPLGTLSNSSMSLSSGGIWYFTFTNYLENQTISYRIYACDMLGNINSTIQYSFGYFDTVGPNILSVVQEPIVPGYDPIVNITVHITDYTQITVVEIETNQTGTLTRYLMTPSGGNSQDGMWKYTFTEYPSDETVTYQIFARDVLGNLNSTGQYILSYPNIISVLQAPSGSLEYQEPVNITVHITDHVQISVVEIEANYTGVLVRYSMTLLSGSLYNGIWNYTITNYPVNRTISYQIFVQNAFGNHNQTSPFNFGYFDLLAPLIVSIVQIPSNPAFEERVNVTVHITDDTLIQVVEIETNYYVNLTRYPMIWINGTLQDGFWGFSFPSTPANRTVLYSIYVRDILVNQNQSTSHTFGFVDTIGPTIVSVVHFPSYPTYEEDVKVTVHITEPTKIQAVMIETNYTSVFIRYLMTQVNGSLQDGFWEYTFTNYPANRTISYRIYTTDTFDNPNLTVFYTFGYFDTVGPNIISVGHQPSDPTYNQNVIVTIHLTELSQIQVVEIETNYTSLFVRYPMTQVNGSLQDGFWEYTFTNYPANRTISYRIHTRDVFGNPSQTDLYNFSYFDTLGPNIVSAEHLPSAPIYNQNVIVTIHLTELSQIQAVEIETNYTSLFVRYPMTQVNGTLQDGFWEYTFTNYPANRTISYRIHARDVFGNPSQTGLYNFSHFDTLGPNIVSVLQTPLIPVYQEAVNITVHITEPSQIQMVAIETNYTSALIMYPMIQISGTVKDGFWRFTITTYPVNQTLIYRIYTKDILGNLNQTIQYSFSHFDTLGPNIVSVLQTPLVPAYQQAVNITVHITEPSQIQMVAIETNYTSALIMYPMIQISGTAKDGFWRFTIATYPVNQTIIYRIYTKDILGNLNQTVQYGFGFFDTLGPNIVSVNQLPASPGYEEAVSVTVHIKDGTQIQVVQIESNYTSTLARYFMMQLSGNSQDGVWEFIFNNYPINKLVIYRIITRDIFGNLNSTGQSSFGAFDNLAPSIVSILQTPPVLTTVEFVDIKTRITENFEMVSVKVEHNATGTWMNQSMNLWSGTLQDGIWDLVFLTYPINQTIQYRIFATDISGRINVSSFNRFGIFPIVTWDVLPYQEIQVNMAQTKEFTIKLEFQNTGSTTLLNLNFTIIELPVGWNSSESSKIIGSLNPGSSTNVVFKVAALSEQGVFYKNITIRFEATIQLTGGKCSDDHIKVGIRGVIINVGPDWFMIILFIVIGSTVGLAVSLYVIQRRRKSSAQPSRSKAQVLAALRTNLAKDFPESYTILSPTVIERINNMKALFH